jgi:hypothetical protein
MATCLMIIAEGTRAGYEIMQRKGIRTYNSAMVHLRTSLQGLSMFFCPARWASVTQSKVLKLQRNGPVGAQTGNWPECYQLCWLLHLGGVTGAELLDLNRRDGSFMHPWRKKAYSDICSRSAKAFLRAPQLLLN